MNCSFSISNGFLVVVFVLLSAGMQAQKLTSKYYQVLTPNHKIAPQYLSEIQLNKIDHFFLPGKNNTITFENELRIKLVSREQKELLVINQSVSQNFSLPVVRTKGVFFILATGDINSLSHHKNNLPPSFPHYFTSGDKDYDNQSYKKRKKAWIEKNQQTYLNLSR